jgi:hypothetical protein
MTKRIESGRVGGVQAPPAWADPNVQPDRFLYRHLGPWLQPATAYRQCLRKQPAASIQF